MAEDFTKLEVWQLSIDLTERIYKITEKFPLFEKYNLVSQIRRAVSSIGANIAEGAGRYHYKDNIKFLYNARGSLFETKHFIILSYKLGFISCKDFDSFDEDIVRLNIKLNNFINSIYKKLNDK